MTPILNALQVAELLGCTPETVADHALAGRLPGYKFGTGWIFSSELLVEAVKKMSLASVEKKIRPARASAVLVVTPKKKQLPGFSMLSADLQARIGH
jgi:excisionase family DNA binding protein